MKANTKTVLSLGYWFGALSFGLLIHPYITTRKMVRDKLLRPLVLLPAVSGVAMWLAAFVLVRLGSGLLKLLGLSFPVEGVYGLGFWFWWVGWFLVFWQGVLGYLWLRFVKALK